MLTVYPTHFSSFKIVWLRF